MTQSILVDLSENTGDYWLEKRVPVLDKPSQIQFIRDVVGAYHPAILTGIVDDWGALRKWNKDYFIQTLGNRYLNINLTPDGHGDCVKDVDISCITANNLDSSNQNNSSAPHFIYPAECKLTLAEFFELLEAKGAISCCENNNNNNSNAALVPYLSQQNDNLRVSMPELLADITASLPLADEAFANNGCPGPEAVNLWIGDERSVSSIHKDHFENMYVVIQGEKTFTLYPPTDVAFLPPEKEYPTLRYFVSNDDFRSISPSSVSCNSNAEDNSSRRIESEHTMAATGTTRMPVTELQLKLTAHDCPSDKLRWCYFDPEVDVTTANNNNSSYNDNNSSSSNDEHRFHDLIDLAHPIRCTVTAGQVLYIPAMWYHRVSQNCLTVSVNYWYDQKFDFR